jgi:hypothetical protein
MYFGLEKYAIICSKKKGWVQSIPYIGSTLETNTKEMDPRIAYKYLGIERSRTWSIKMRKKIEEGIDEESEISFGHRIKCQE